jgi:hypothetical protein
MREFLLRRASIFSRGMTVAVESFRFTAGANPRFGAMNMI